MRNVILCLLMLATGLALAVSSEKENAPPRLHQQIETVWGPDAFGYIGRDSNEPNGPPVDWIDISGIGTMVTGLGDDNIVGPFNIGFPFRYYWYDVTSFHVGSNGYIRFSGTGQLSSPFTIIPNAIPPNDILCPYTADFDPSTAGTVYYWSNNTDSLIVSFVNLPAWLPTGSSGSHDFQIVLSMVDTSITFNIGPQSGTFYNAAGMSGIENSAGDIGIQTYNTNTIPANYSMKFYYPQDSPYEVHDIGVTTVYNENSGGFFVQTGNDLQANGIIANLGNQNEGDFYVVAEVREFPGNTLVYSDSVFVDTLEAGESMQIDFTETWTMNNTGDFYLRMIANLPGDLVASNDQKDVEFHVVDLPGELSFDDGSSEQTWTWAGGMGGMGIYYLPPAYPVKVTQISAYLGSGTLPVLLEIYDDDGPNGQPGTQLTSVSLSAPTLGWYAVNLSDSNIVINDGGVYAAWRMTGEGSSGIGLDQNSIASRQTWEFTGVWAVFRNTETDDAMIRLSVEPQGQIVFQDDFESGTANWTGDWALTTATSHSPSNSYTDSPGGNYPPSSTLIGEMAGGIDLSSFVGAALEFYTKYELESGFDYCYLEASTDGGSNWILVKTYNGEGVVTEFSLQTIDIGAFAGVSDFRIRFRLVTDAGYETDGMYVDDLKIIGSFIDESPPLMLFEAPEHYEGVPDTFHFPVVITDLSGVASAELNYWVDDVLPVIITISPTSVSNDTFYFDIPTQEHGALVRFYLEAEDGASPSNSATSDTMAYISGLHQIYDDGEPEFITSTSPGGFIATRFDMPAGDYPEVTTALLRIYTDSNRPVDDVTVHIWTDNGGTPGTDLVNPFMVTPAATLENPEAWTIVDLRDLNIEPASDFWIGYENTSSIDIWHLYDSPVLYGRSFLNSGAGWTAFSGDFHNRCVLGSPPVGIDIGEDALLPKEFSLAQNFPNPFNPATTIKYALKENAEVTLKIYNVLGQLVKTLVAERQPAGYKSINWDGTNESGARVASGIYIYRLEANSFVQARKLVLLK